MRRPLRWAHCLTGPGRPGGGRGARGRWAGADPLQGDSGYYSHKVAERIVARDCLFRLAVPRTAPLWRAVARVHDDWIDARGYEGAQVALIDYVPPGWPEGTRVVARRVHYDVEEISADARSRRTRTVGKDQLVLALGGELDEVFAYSFFATNEELDLDEEIAQAEWAFRRRTRIEELFRDAAYGAGLSHLPSASHAVNSMWMWGALLAYNLSAWLQMLAPLGTARRRIATIRRLLIHRAARWTTTPRRNELHFTAETQEFSWPPDHRPNRAQPPPHCPGKPPTQRDSRAIGLPGPRSPPVTDRRCVT